MSEPTQVAVVRATVRAVRCGIVAVFVEGVRRRDPGAVVNAVVSLGASYLPGVVEREFGVDFRPWQRAYAALAMLAHAVGMLGPYDDVWWWDHVTHTFSATLLGGLAHVAARRRGRDPRPRVVATVVSLGVIWEVVEWAIHAVCDRLGFEPVLVHYSRRDTVLDLVFNLLGALLVVAFGDCLLRNFLGD